MLTSANFSGVDFRGLNNIAFKAKDINIAQKTQTQLSKEENEREILDLSLNAGIKVIFEDTLNKTLISLNLTEQNFKTLKDNFNKNNNFYQREDGSIRLNGEAENFISSWFYDFAHELNFLNADSNKEKLINGNETNNAYAHASLITFGPNSVTFNTLGKISYALAGYSNLSIEEGINTRIEQDKDLNGEIKFSEKFSQKDLNIFANTARNIAQGEDEDLEFKSKKEDLLQKVLTQGINALNQKELEEFKFKYPKEYENLKQEQVKFELSKDFLGQFLNKDFKMLDLKV